ncbi:MAG: LysR family transcriptional regulator, partial [Paludibacterium sp.]
PDGQVRLRVNDMALAVEMAQAGHGILYCPVTAALSALETGQLCNPLPLWQGAALPIYALWPPQRTLPARVRVLLDHLLAFSAAHPRLAKPSH